MSINQCQEVAKVFGESPNRFYDTTEPVVYVVGKSVD